MYLESPAIKIEDLKSAVDYFSNLKQEEVSLAIDESSRWFRKVLKDHD